MIGTDEGVMERFTDAANRREALLDQVDRGVPRPDLDALLIVGRFPGFRALDRLAMLLQYPRATDLCAASPTDVEMTIGRLLRKSRWEPERLQRAIEIDHQWMSYGDDRKIIWVGDSEYPMQLRRVYDMPAILYVRGSVPEGDALTVAPTVAAVGTRRPDRDGLVAAYNLGRELAGCGVSVVSGLARGIDAAVHRGVVAERNGAPPIVVLGSGVDTIYPSEHRDLAVDILRAGGAIVSEYPPGRSPAKHQFPARNRIIVGLSSATVLLQAPERSGALISAELAQDLGHDVMVHAVGAGWTGGAALLESGATRIESAADVIAAHPGVLQTSPGVTHRRRTESPGADRSYDPRSDLLAAFGPQHEPASLSEMRKMLRGEADQQVDPSDPVSSFDGMTETTEEREE